MTRYAARAVVSVLAAIALLMAVGCDFSTRVISSADPPEKVLESFMSALSGKDFNRADSFLADSATIRPVDHTGYSFMDTLVSVSLGSLEYSLSGAPEINGTAAKAKVTVRSLDRDAMIDWLEQNLTDFGNKYMDENGLSELNLEDHDSLSKVISAALVKYAETGARTENTIYINFRYEDDQWKIIGDADLVAAIFGGKADEVR